MTTTTAVSAPASSAWKDAKRYWWLLSPALPLLGLASVIAVLSGFSAGWLWALPVVFYGLAPLLDLLIGEDRSNAPESAVDALSADRYYQRIVFAYIPSQYLMTILAAWLAVSGGLPWWHLLGLVMATGIVNGVAINTAHELGHKTNALERWLSRIVLAPVAYGHFFIEHNKGHHKHVATPEDPASARMGESFWRFLPRTVLGSLKSAWSIEKARLERNGQSLWSVRNENLQSWALTVLLFGALSLWLGPWALVFLVAQAAFGFSLLEVVNYMEHYGLRRRKLAGGRYERCQPQHSWNSNHVVTNLLLYQLQRHSDHHAHPTRRYQGLRHFDDAPQLPSGYAGMILVAYLPALWFRMMDRRVVEHYGGDITQANLHPGRRAALLARWMPGVEDPATGTASAAGDAGAQTAHTVSEKECAGHQCPNCHYVYDPRQACPHEGYPAGTPWSALPDDFPCPNCAVREKPDFVPVMAEAVAAR
ncbi:fatty acid desaturase [Algiphilus sp. NNCM1]|uniref:fatty acid desaturase n=1 Tax=Algiphilus sp. TaxID=1872431 RepID=UPI001CA63D01|nr:fatty acid desaturase [Algiphilus sp.]MBY8965236.1 fatty acid desaturase [Algiphilus acroporae]MCI5063630.1 fatty acid desaturase [Algiphilus sp.]MCI5104827.1 fatty acid desaturase [Algiphilus sp.]